MSGSTKRSDTGQIIRRFVKPSIRKLVLGAVKAGIPYKFTKGGVMFYGANGMRVTIHTTESDRRAEKNTIARFKRIGYNPEGKS